VLGEGRGCALAAPVLGDGRAAAVVPLFAGVGCAVPELQPRACAVCVLGLDPDAPAEAMRL
jgi:hypothetical protein